MDQDHANTDHGYPHYQPDNGWQQHSDSETDELGLRIAAHARQQGEEWSRGNNDSESPSPSEVRLRVAARTRSRDTLQKENERPLRDRLDQHPATKPREPFWRAKERRAEKAAAENSDALRPKQHVRAVSDGGPSADDPPVNIPQVWGSRNRHRASWLRRSTTESEGLGLVESVKRVDENTVLMRQTSFTGDDILATSGENASLSGRRLRQFSSPSSLRHMNTTLQSAAPDVDELDFNGASVLVSTPAVKGRNRKIDELMKEDEQVETEKESLTSQRQSRFALGGRREHRPVSAPGGGSKTLLRRRRSIKDKEDAMKSTEENPRALSTVPSEDDDQSAHGRHESIDLLRKLARASSLTPSPAPEQPARQNLDRRRKSDAERGRVAKEKWDASDVPTIRQRGREVKRPLSGLFSKSAETRVEKVDETQKARGPFSKLAERDPRRINSEPLQPKSALEAIVQEARAIRDPNIGDSTMASLEDIVNPSTDQSTLTTAAGEKPAAQQAEEVDIAGVPPEENRRREDREFELANRRLRVARTSIKDADRGLRRLENKLESTDTEPAQTTAEHKAGTQSPASDTRQAYRFPGFPPGLVPYTDHNGRTKCRHCGGSYTSVWRGLFVEFRELFYTWGQAEKGSPFELTWLGLLVVTWWTWIFSEMLMSHLFEYTLRDAHFPFITITLIWRALSEPWESAKWLIGVGGNLVFGDSSTVAGPVASSSTWLRRAAQPPIRERVGARGNDGDWIAAAAAATAATARRVVKSAMEAVDEAGTMWDDEYLDF